MEPKERIRELTDLLNEANTKYYVLDAPEMPDFEYDRLLRELRSWKARTRSWHCRIPPPSGWAARL